MMFDELQQFDILFLTFYSSNDKFILLCLMILKPSKWICYWWIGKLCLWFTISFTDFEIFLQEFDVKLDLSLILSKLVCCVVKHFWRYERKYFHLCYKVVYTKKTFVAKRWCHMKKVLNAELLCYSLVFHFNICKRKIGLAKGSCHFNLWWFQFSKDVCELKIVEDNIEIENELVFLFYPIHYFFNNKKFKDNFWTRFTTLIYLWSFWKAKGREGINIKVE